MCRFHSFLWQCATGDIFDEEGVVHHSEIAVKCGIDQDRFLLPEFDLAERRLDFDGKTWDQIYGIDPRNDSDFGFSVPALASRQKKWTNRGMDRLNHYLVDRFGSANALIDFVEPQWDIAGSVCATILRPGAWEPPEQPKPDLPKLILSVDRTDGVKEWKVDIEHPDVATFGVRHFTSMPSRVRIQCSPSCLPFDLNDGIVDGFLLSLITSDHIAGEIAVRPTGVRYCSAEDEVVIDGDEILMPIPKAPNFDEWKQLFKLAKNRIDVWKKNRVEMLV